MGRGQWMESRTTWLLVGPDGEFSLHRKSDGAQLWKAGTAWRGGWTWAQLQTDGNLAVLYSEYNGPIKQLTESGTYNNYGAYAVVQDDGNLVIYRKDGAPLWQTGTYGRV